jgi:hypothetical protein
MQYQNLMETKGFNFSRANKGERKHRCAARDLKCFAYYESDEGFVVSEDGMHNEACTARAARKLNNVYSKSSALGRDTEEQEGTATNNNNFFETPAAVEASKMK